MMWVEDTTHLLLPLTYFNIHWLSCHLAACISQLYLRYAIHVGKRGPEAAVRADVGQNAPGGELPLVLVSCNTNTPEGSQLMNGRLCCDAAWDAGDHMEERCLCFPNINRLHGLLQAPPVGGQTAGGAESAAVGCSFSACRLSPAANRRKNNDCGTAATFLPGWKSGGAQRPRSVSVLVTPRRRPTVNVSESISVALTNRAAPASTLKTSSLKTVTQFLAGRVHRPHREQFTQRPLLRQSAVPMKTVSSVNYPE